MAKGKKDKGSNAASSAPTPGSASEQPGEDVEESEATNHETLVEEFVASSTVAMDCLGDLLDLTMRRIGERHTQNYTDQYTANAACDALTDLTDWLYLTCEDEATLDDFSALKEPASVEIDAWAENATVGEVTSFTTTKRDEVVDMYNAQRSLGQHIAATHQALLPEWLRPDLRPASSIVATSLYSQTVMTPQPKTKTAASSPTKSQLPHSRRSTASKNDKSTVQSKPASSSSQRRSIASADKSTSSPSKPVAAPPAQSKTLSAGRMRQFRRRSEQHKAQKQQATIQEKLSKGPSNRLEPIRNTAHHSSNLPSVQIIDPNQEAQDARRKALRNGKVRPQTESEIKLVGGPYKKSQTKKSSPKKQHPAKVPSLRNAIEHELNEVKTSRIATLPETLVDSLAISDGSLGGSLLESNAAEDFERLKPVQVSTAH